MQLVTLADQKCSFLSKLVNRRHHWALCRERNKKRRRQEGRRERMRELCGIPRNEVCVSLSPCLSFVESFPWSHTSYLVGVDKREFYFSLEPSHLVSGFLLSCHQWGSEYGVLFFHVLPLHRPLYLFKNCYFYETKWSNFDLSIWFNLIIQLLWFSVFIIAP